MASTYPMRKLFLFFVCAAALAVLPVALQGVGHAWVRILDTALLYILLALGLNLVVGLAGLLDLGYIAFYAIGAYLMALLSSPHLVEHFPLVAQWFPDGLHASAWLVFPLAALLAGFAGMVLGAPTLRLRGDYLAIVTLGFGEIIRVFLNNLDNPINVTNGPKGIDRIESLTIFGVNLGEPWHFAGFDFAPVTLHYYVLLAAVVLAVIVCVRLSDSRLGRAWRAVREDEVAAKAMGLNTRNLKLLAFGLGASFGGVAGVLFASLQTFVSPESFSLQESILVVAMVVLGGLGHVPGVILGAFLLAALPEVLRYVGDPLQAMTDGRLDAAILRQLLVALAMIGIMLLRPRGLWPDPKVQTKVGK
jgi:branched-chain amino acid transport system permease protein